jgi:putative colanic acid biosynthesis acetyltransferase WcaF
MASQQELDLSSYSSHFPLRLMVMRVVWGMTWWLLFRPTPRIAFGWRRLILRLFGAKIGRGARVYPNTWIWAPWNLRIGDWACLGPEVDCYSVAQVTLGDHATVSQRASLCTASHDISDPGMKLLTAPIHIESSAWICAGAFVHPGRHVGEGAVVGAMACLTQDVPAWEVWAGNPAVFVKSRSLHTSVEP